MKSTEEKAKLYDEAIEKLRKFYRDYDTVSRLIDVKEELANLFPELKESEDEQKPIDPNTLIQQRVDALKWYNNHDAIVTHKILSSK